MPLLPCHAYGSCETERRPRKYMLLIRQLGTTFILLLCLVFLVCYAFTRLVGWKLDFNSLPPLSSIRSLTAFRAKLIDSQYRWDNIRQGEHCLRYATREYTSRLVQFRGFHNPMEAMRACRETPVEIHGRQLKSDWCQDLGLGRGIYGFWIVDFQEADCETRWGEFDDLGCYDRSEAHPNSTETHAAEAEKAPIRRVGSRLENLKDGSNWQIMCVTTPAEIYGRRFGSPAACFNDIRQGVYGEWDIEDTSCGLISGPKKVAGRTSVP